MTFNDSRKPLRTFWHQAFAIDGELLVVRDGRVQSFNVLQQRLNRKAVTPRLMKEFPVHLRAYDLLDDGDNDLRELPFEDRRRRLVDFIAASTTRVSTSRRRCPSPPGANSRQPALTPPPPARMPTPSRVSC